MTVDRRYKNTLKTTIAILIVYGFSIALNWPHPGWAAIQVLLVSQLAFLGSLLENTIFRVIGSIYGAILGLACMVLFYQLPLVFIAVNASVIVITLYFMQRGRPYSWFTVCTTFLIVTTSTLFHNSYAVLQIAVDRLTEVVLGLTVALLVHGLIWRQLAGQHFYQQLQQTAHQCCELLRQKIHWFRQGQATSLPANDALYGSVLTLRSALNAAILDTSAVRDQQGEYEQLIDRLSRIAGLITVLGELLQTTHSDDQDHQTHYRVYLLDFMMALEQDMSQITKYLATVSSPTIPILTPPIKRPNLQQLQTIANPLQRIAWLAIADKLDRLAGEIDQANKIFQRLAQGNKTTASTATTQPVAEPHSWRQLKDPLLAALSFVLCMILWHWTGWPSLLTTGAIFSVMAISMGILLPFPTTPHALVLGSIVGMTLAAFFHFFIMPHVSQFSSLALLLAPCFFVIAYLGSHANGAVVLGATFCGMSFSSMIGFNSQQTNYTLLPFINHYLGLLGGLGIGVLLSALFSEPSPERRFAKGVRHFLRHSAHLLADAEPKALWQEQHYPHYLAYKRRLTQRLLILYRLADQLDYGLYRENSPEQVQALLTCFNGLLFRLLAFVRNDRRDLHRHELTQAYQELRHTEIAMGELLQQYQLVLRRSQLWPLPAPMDMSQRLVDSIMAIERHPNDEVRQAATRLMIASGNAYGLQQAINNCQKPLAELNWRIWHRPIFR